ncbi:MAG: tRNA lysidine(34) synthetase TilS [Pirellulales bacterium]|nr:tRNA lysidine(34) synthetase TilS [Pirellulales bacterium]
MEPARGTALVPATICAAWPPTGWADVHVLVAVSGGPDSMALLRALLALKLDCGGRGRVFAAHINHALRGDASDADEAWLHEQCVDLGTPLRTERVSAAALATRQGDGLEAAARQVRYRLLTAIAERTGCRFVVTAHTQDDQVETVLFRLLRGTGLRGLAGIRRSRPLSASVTLMRPMLDCRRSSVLAFLEAIGQTYRSDATNHDRRFARNRTRGELLPYLREHFNAEVDAAIVRTAGLAAEAQEIVDGVAAGVLSRCREAIEGRHAVRPASGFRLGVSPLVDQPLLIVAEVLRQAWRLEKLPEQNMTQRWWRQLTEYAIAAKPHPALNLPGGFCATRPLATEIMVAPAPGLS